MMWIISLVCAILIFVLVFFIRPLNQASPQPIKIAPSPSAVSSTSPAPLKILGQKTIPQKLHVFQTFNNCGRAALSMALSYYDINVSQEELGVELRPWQNPQGVNDDKSVTLEELGNKAKDFGLIPYHRPNGNIDLIKKFIAHDLPVITRTLTNLEEDIGHYRVVKGYNDETGQIIQDDSLQNKNLWFSYADFSLLWKQFNFEYLILVPKDKDEIAQNILGENKDPYVAWQKAVQNSQKQLEENQYDIYARFNLS